jgi:hypothetical protein
MREACNFIRTIVKGKHEAKKLKKTTVRKSMPFVMGCDLCSGPDDAAYEVLMSQDIFSPGNCWKKPEAVSEDAVFHYKAIEDNFHKMKNKGTLDPLIQKLASVYMKSTYSHGEHTSRSSTTHGPNK